MLPRLNGILAFAARNQRRPGALRLTKLMNGAAMDGDLRLANPLDRAPESGLTDLCASGFREAAAGVEVRGSFLDPDPVEDAARLKTPHRQGAPVGRWALGKEKEPYPPSEVMPRPRGGFEAPLHRWTRSGLRARAGDLRSDEPPPRRLLDAPRGAALSTLGSPSDAR